MSGDIKVNTKILRDYASKIDRVNRRLIKVDGRLKTLYVNVPVNELLSLIKVDALTGYSWRLTSCSGYLRETAFVFERVETALKNEDILSSSGSVISKVSDSLFDVGAAVKKGAGKVSSLVEKVVNGAIESYHTGGTVYKIAQYGKVAVTAAKGVVKITSAVGSLIGSGGLSTPVAVLTLISGMNDITNATSDAIHIHNEEYDQVGQNMLKDKLVKGGRVIGSALGNEKVGELVGNTTYYGIDIVTSLASLGEAMDKVKQLSPTNLSKLGAEAKEIGNLDVSKIFTTDIQTLQYHTKLAGYEFKETANLFVNSNVLTKVSAKAVDVGKGINNIYVSYNEDFQNPVINTIDKVTKAKKHSANTIKTIIKFGEIIF